MRNPQREVVDRDRTSTLGRRASAWVAATSARAGETSDQSSARQRHQSRTSEPRRQSRTPEQTNLPVQPDYERILEQRVPMAALAAPDDRRPYARAVPRL